MLFNFLYHKESKYCPGNTKVLITILPACTMSLHVVFTSVLTYSFIEKNFVTLIPVFFTFLLPVWMVKYLTKSDLILFHLRCWYSLRQTQTFGDESSTRIIFTVQSFHCNMVYIQSNPNPSTFLIWVKKVKIIHFSSIS